MILPRVGGGAGGGSGSSSGNAACWVRTTRCRNRASRRFTSPCQTGGGGGVAPGASLSSSGEAYSGSKRSKRIPHFSHRCSPRSLGYPHSGHERKAVSFSLLLRAATGGVNLAAYRCAGRCFFSVTYLSFFVIFRRAWRRRKCGRRQQAHTSALGSCLLWLAVCNRQPPPSSLQPPV